MKFDRAALKQEVRQDLRDTRPKATTVALTYLLVSCGINLLMDLIRLPMTNILQSAWEELQWMALRLSGGAMTERELLAALESMELFDVLGSIVTLGLLFGLFSAAVNWTLTFAFEGYCLRMVRGKNPGFRCLLCPFPKWGWVLLTGFLTMLFTALWAILLCVLGTIASAVLLVLFLSDTSLGITLVIVVWMAVVAAMISISLRYAMADYILLDEPVDALEAISRSKAMMRGRKFHLFVLMLSFIGWLLLAALVGAIVTAVGGAISDSAAAGVVTGALAQLLTLPLTMWLQPYVVGSTAKFYDWMKHTDIAQGVWEGRCPRERRPAEKQNTIRIEPIADREPEAPEIPAYEETEQPERADQPEMPEAPEEQTAVEPEAPAEEIPDRPDYE